MYIFVDDERFPVNDGRNWIIVRTMSEFINLITNSNDKIEYISFDHDLGNNEPTGIDITKWLVEYDMDHNIISNDFDYFVHSQNPVGKMNIESYLNNYIKYKKTT